MEQNQHPLTDAAPNLVKAALKNLAQSLGTTQAPTPEFKGDGYKILQRKAKQALKTGNAKLWWPATKGTYVRARGAVSRRLRRAMRHGKQPGQL